MVVPSTQVVEGEAQDYLYVEEDLQNIIKLLPKIWYSITII